MQASLLQHNEQEALSPKKLHQKVIELLSSNADLAEAVSWFVLFCKKKIQVADFCNVFHRKLVSCSEVFDSFYFSIT